LRRLSGCLPQEAAPGDLPGSARSTCRRARRGRASCRADRCVKGITANVEHLRATVANSIGIVTALNPYIGYKNATAVAQEAHATGGSVYDIVVAKGLLTRAQLDEILRPEILTRPVPLDLPEA